jgi:hypothetical protein
MGAGLSKLKQNVNIKGPPASFFLFGDEDFVFTFKSQYYAHWLHMGEDVFASKLGYSFGPLYFWMGEGGISHSFENQICNYVIALRGTRWRAT